jgi:hypothetical protein
MILIAFLHVSGLEYIRNSIPNQVDEAVSGSSDDNSDDSDNFFATKKRSKSSPLECYHATMEMLHL